MLTRSLFAAATAVASIGPGYAIECGKLVEQYQARRVEAPNLPNLFSNLDPSGSTSWTDDAATLGFDLTCDATGQVEALRYAVSWEGKFQPSVVLDGIVSMTVLASPFAPDRDFVVALFERTSATLGKGDADLAGPYRASMEPELFGIAGGVVTLWITPDE